MNRSQRRSHEYRDAFTARQQNQPATLTKVPPSQWPKCEGTAVVVEVWRSRKFLVVLYDERYSGPLRMTVNRAELNKSGKWVAEITWDELMRCKREIGRGEQWAVELFPPEAEVVNVANMRHLWLLDAAPDYGWRKMK